MNLAEFNTLSQSKASELFSTCCGSSTWVKTMMNNFPFDTELELVKIAELNWYEQTAETDWLEAFSHHPRIGDTKSLAEKFASTSHYAGKEQGAVSEASRETISQLAERNNEYAEKFGFIFIVSATGKSADTMLRILNDRMTNTREEELNVAMGEQYKITLLRLKKMLAASDWSFLKPGQLTTHVLDTSIGKPGENIGIRLYHYQSEHWRLITQGLTNRDGRFPDLLPSHRTLPAGIFKLVFAVGQYYRSINLTSFYPEVEIQFNIFDQSHYHVPLLVNPFGYSTYRGS